jgi:hypothetical protein
MTMVLELTQDPRAEAIDVCGEVDAAGAIEWICVAARHDDPPAPGLSDPADQHYFVPRFPWRNGDDQ